MELSDQPIERQPEPCEGISAGAVLVFGAIAILIAIIGLSIAALVMP